MTKRVHTPAAPEAIGPYSQAILSGGLVFCSGQIAIDPETKRLIDGDATAQTRQVMQNLGAVLDAAGASFASVLKTTIYLAQMDDFAAVNAVYGEAFDEVPPARATVAVAALPLGACVEIDVIAFVEG